MNNSSLITEAQAIDVEEPEPDDGNGSRLTGIGKIAKELQEAYMDKPIKHIIKSVDSYVKRLGRIFKGEEIRDTRDSLVYQVRLQRGYDLFRILKKRTKIKGPRDYLAAETFYMATNFLIQEPEDKLLYQARELLRLVALKERRENFYGNLTR